MILVSILKAEAKRMIEAKERGSVIYALDEPETSQRPPTQRILLDCFQAIADIQGTQIILTSHSLGFDSHLPAESPRYVRKDPVSGFPVVAEDEKNLWAELADELERMILAAAEFMPVVLIMVDSTPRSLNAIDWAVAEYRGGTVHLHGEETIWKPEFVATSVIDDVESFDSGTPVVPSLELQTQDRTPNA